MIETRKDGAAQGGRCRVSPSFKPVVKQDLSVSVKTVK